MDTLWRGLVTLVAVDEQREATSGCVAVVNRFALDRSLAPRVSDYKNYRSWRYEANPLRRLRADYPAAYIACVFDAKGKTFRDDMYPEYKASTLSNNTMR